MPGRKLPVKRGETRPLAIQLAQAVADEIVRGVYRDGDKLPGERQLAEMWSVSDKTAREAIGLLASKRLLRKGVRTQPAVIVATPEQAREVWAELAKFEARSDSARLDDLEARMGRVERAQGSSEGGREPVEDIAELRKLVETVRDRLGVVEAKVLGAEEERRERGGEDDREQEGGTRDRRPETEPVARRQ